MNAVVFLALLGVAAARPQFPYPVLTYANAGDHAKVVTSPLTYTYPTTYGTFPYTYPNYPYASPFAYPVVANPVVTKAETKTDRSKRSADAEPEPEADPHTVYTGIPFTGTTTYHYPTYPAVSTYSAFPNFPFTYGYPTVGLPYTNVVKTV